MVAADFPARQTLSAIRHRCWLTIVREFSRMFERRQRTVGNELRICGQFFLGGTPVPRIFRRSPCI